MQAWDWTDSTRDSGVGRGPGEPAEARQLRGQAAPPSGLREGCVTGDIARPHWCRTVASPQQAEAVGTGGTRPGH